MRKTARVLAAACLLVLVASRGGLAAAPAPSANYPQGDVKDFIEAIQAGNVDAVRAGLNKHPEWLNAAGSGGIEMTPLHRAALAGHAKVVELFLDRGAQTEVWTKYDKETPLYFAARGNHVDVAKLLIAKGADVNAKGNKGQTALHIALMNRNKEMAQLLADKGAEVDIFAAAALGRVDRMRALLDANPALVSAQVGRGWSPLLMAAVGGSREAAELLLAKGAVVGASDFDGMTPLHVANKAVAELLIAKGANLNSKSRSDSRGTGTPLHQAAYEGRTDAAEALVAAGADLNAANRSGETPLYVAAQYGQSAVAAVLLAAGANVEARDAFRLQTPLHIASRMGKAEVVKLLIANKSDVNARTNDAFNCTPLCMAAEEGHKEVVELLLAGGADINGLYRGAPAITWAASRGHAEVVRLLIAKGADLNKANGPMAWTPLHEAARGGHKEVVELLLASGADINAKDKDGHTPLQLGATLGNPEVAAILRAHAAKATGGIEPAAKSPADSKAFFAAIGNSEIAVVRAGLESHPGWLEEVDPEGLTPLATAASSGDKNMVEFLLGKGAAVNAHNTRALSAAAIAGHTDTMRLLIAKGANVNATGGRMGSFTALHVAAMMGKKDAAELLIEHGASLNTRTTESVSYIGLSAGVTPLYIAVGGGHLDLVTLLLAKGADVNVKDERGVTPLYIAAGCGRLDLVTLLLAKGADVNIKDEKGETALDVAIKEKRNEVADLLRKHGAKQK